MSDPVSTGPVQKVPQTLGEKLSFSIPAIVVALVLALGIGYAITAMVDGETRKFFATEMSNQKTLFDKKISETEKTLQDTQKELTDVSNKAKKLEDEKQKLATELTRVSTEFSKVAGDFSKFVEGQKDLDKSQTQDLGKHEANINSLETRVKYIDEKLKKLDELAKDVGDLKVDTAGLKDEYKVLKTDLTAVRTKADVTEKDLADLGERARMFQLRVLAARAREAADAARQVDLKNLLNRLDDVEGK